MSSTISLVSSNDRVDGYIENYIDLSEVDSSVDKTLTETSQQQRVTRLRKRDRGLSSDYVKPAKYFKKNSAKPLDIKTDADSTPSPASFSTLSNYTSYSETRTLESETPSRPHYPSVHELMDAVVRVGESLNFHCGRLTSASLKSFSSKTGKSNHLLNDPAKLCETIIAPSLKPVVLKRAKSKSKKAFPMLTATILEANQSTSGLVRNVDRNLGAAVAPETILEAYERPINRAEPLFNIRHSLLYPWEKDEDCPGGGRWRQRRDLYMDMASKLSLREEAGLCDFNTIESKENICLNKESNSKRLVKRSIVPKKEFSVDSIFTNDHVVLKQLRVLRALQPQVVGFRWKPSGETETLLFWR
ncbi:hypothetical protein Ciccas_001032 [Cichlidogyrus casuarinus]|uniref:Uncharacterized protein n=1 Tax=Cichlidogyrus casuarinus TaxID=1844966 RepID=A0ABD2QL90_9PLAT